MPADDFDHEVIDSPEALFRHLYEAHGVAEALDVDPATAPLQFWLRKHSELERAARRAAAAERPENAQRAGDDVANPEGTPRLIAEPPGSARAPTSQPSARSGASTGPGPSSNRSGRVTHFGRDSGRSNAEVSATGARSATPGPRFRPFTDPLIEAVAVALVGRGMDERSVRRGLSTFAGPGGRHGEAAVRDAFISPMLDEIAARLTGELVGRPDRREPTITRDPRSESASWRNARQPDAAPPPPTPRGPLQPETRPSTPRDPSPTHQTPAATGPTGRTPAPTGRASETTPGAPAAGSQSASAELLAAWPIARPTSRTPGSGSPAASTPGPPASGSRQSSGSPRSRARDASASPGSRPSAEASPSKGSRPPSPPRAPVGAAAREARPAWSGPAEPTPEGIAPGDGAGWVTSSDADFMAIADVLQQRRKPRRAGRKDGTARSSRSDAEDDVMALADAIQRRPDRGGRRDRTR